MKIRKSELQNIINKGWADRRERSLEKRKKNSQATKEWKKRTQEVNELLVRLQKSRNPEDQAEGRLIEKMLKLIKYDF